MALCLQVYSSRRSRRDALTSGAPHWKEPPVARILIESDAGARTLSEKLVGANLADHEYAAKLVERVGWALTEAEVVDSARERAGRPQPGS